MKLSFISLIILSFASFSAMSEVTKDDLSAIKQLVKEQQYEKALEKYIWFHEESKHTVGMGAVRLSFALGDWMDLAQVYPPALAEMEKVRDENAVILRSGEGDFKVYHEFMALNRTLGEEEKTVAMFNFIDKKYPNQGEVYYPATEDLLVAGNQIEVVERHLGDPILKIEKARYDREYDLSQTRRYPERAEIMLDYADNRYIKDTKKLISVLKKLNRLSEAEEVFNRSQAYFANEEIRDTFLN